MERQRQRTAVRHRGRVVDPADKARWFQTYKLSRYGLTQEQFRQLLESQDYRCAMCHDPFDKTVCVDHDHSCCPDEKRSCGRCVRGLLCRACNTALGHIERRYAQARAYLQGWAVQDLNLWPLPCQGSAHPRLS
jgi:hypothetical protein